MELAPSQAVITSIHVEQIEAKLFEDFRIIESNDDGTPDLLITPDFAICDSCAEELNDRRNRRYHYPFITCTKCGPRFSIETGLPYDRERTSMHPFTMCAECEQEFHDPARNRFYSQTNSCPKCKISLWLTDKNGANEHLEEDELVETVCRLISSGAIVAVKGIGGFLLICDPENEKSVLKLRERKHRPSKPFALLYPDRKAIEKDFELSSTELEALRSPEAPIVLLKPQDNSYVSSISSSIAPGLNRLGVMLPYAPLLLLISQQFNKPLLATSGNVSGSPIVYRNEEVMDTLNGFADYFLLNDRDIQVPQDDSVIMYSGKYQHKVMLRRSRGYAPGFDQEAIDPGFESKVLSMGALLKSTFGIWNLGRCHISQFLGDTMEFDAQLSYERTLRHFLELLHFKPEVIVIDKHPAYFTSQLGKELAVAHEAKTVSIQHHKAHFWALLAENQLLTSGEKILGVIFDGTGMGNDGAVWGGEFFTYESGAIKRLHHMAYFPHILGDKMAMEPRLSAMSVLHASGLDYSHEKGNFTSEEIDFYSRVLEESSLKTSSIGRIFDAVSSLLGFCHLNTYEGEAAMYLESAAQQFRWKSNEFSESYNFALGQNGEIEFTEMIVEILQDFSRGDDLGKIALKFHITLVRIIHEIAVHASITSIAFSGGVFQNCLLLDLISDELGKEFHLYFHKRLSPNDEGISYGQLVGYYMKKRSKVKKGESNKTISAI